MANRKPFTCRLRKIVGWLMIVVGGLWGASTGICGVLALIGVTETDSFGARLILCAASLVIAVGSFTIAWLGTRLKNSSGGDGADALTMKKSSPAKEKEKLVPIFLPNLAGYQMKMHTEPGEAYCFTLTGLKAYAPNTSSRCGYGSDEWCFHCKYNGENYILRFCDDASYGTYWDCAWIDKENAERLENLSVVEWLKLVLRSETQIFHLHPDTIDDAKNIVQATSSRCGPISEKGFYGR